LSSAKKIHRFIDTTPYCFCGFLVFCWACKAFYIFRRM
jgi:hypothetical protein